MKNTLFLSFFFSILTVFGVDKPAAIVTKQFKVDYANFVKETETLSQLAGAEHASWTAHEEQFLKMRLAYKRIEHFVDFLDHEYAGDYFNGAPIPKIARKTSQLMILEPVGMQTIAESILDRDAEVYRNLTQQLAIRALEFQPFLNSMHLSERMVFEATREGLIRLTALGITGFDSPIIENTLPECQTSLTALEDVTKAYYSYCSEKDVELISTLFKGAISYFEVTDFDQFDRFGIIQQVINPLYKQLLITQKNLSIETRDLVGNAEYSVNYNAESFFDTDFLNYRYYSKYSAAGDPKKREELGRILFFDPILSHDNERACASCHQPEKAFSDGQTKSLASNGLGTVKRNSPGLMNSVYNTRFFWDVRASTPEDQIEHVIFSEKEFNTNYDEILSKLNSSEDYLALFKAAYPELQNSRFSAISRYTLVASIGAYLQSLRSFKSPFDKAIQSANERPDFAAGFNLFAGKAKCATCHFIPTFAGNVPPLYTETETEVIGVPKTANQENAELDDDFGRYSNGRPKEKADFQQHAFKTASLRNIGLTAPYMHNGVFTTLEEVMEFYNVGGGHGWGIAPENATLSPDSLHLTPQEIDQVIDFLQALTDTTGWTGKPKVLPTTSDSKLNQRKIGGSY